MIIQGDSLSILKTLEDKSINCCVTSPPYYGLRDYGTNEQIGQEKTPEEYIQKLVSIFGEVKRVLRDDGTLWLNIGDSYAGSGKGGAFYPDAVKDTKQGTNKGIVDKPNLIHTNKLIGYKAKDLIGIPWMLAFALRYDGWYLRQDIIWHKPNPMPESVKDRCTRSHEYIFLLSKSKKYYYDSDAIKEHTVYPTGTRTDKKQGEFKGKRHAHEDYKHISDSFRAIRDYRNKRDVWTVSVKPYRGAHFATFPPELIEPCILAGCPKGGTALEVFSGSGTVGAVAAEYGREFIGIEINPDYCPMSKKRIEAVQMKIDLGS